MTVEIREYRPGDLAALRRLVVALHEAMRALDPSLPPAGEIIDAYFRHLVESSDTSDGTFYVAEADDRLVGYVCVFGRVAPSDPDEPPEASSFVADLFVEPGVQGLGVGKRLMETAEARARSLGVTQVDLKVLATNRQALAFYRTLGYQPRIVELRKAIAPSDGSDAP